MTILFVVNPVSGGSDKTIFLNTAIHFCESRCIDTSVFYTSLNDTTEQLKFIIEEVNPDKIIVVGGDGTIRFTAIAAYQSNIPIGIMPFGTANGLAAELNVNSELIDTFEQILRSDKTEDVDLLQINGTHYLLHIGDVGVNAEAIHQADKQGGHDAINFAKIFVEKLRSAKPFDIIVKANGQEFLLSSYMLAICNARKYGTGIPLNLTGIMNDGKFELVSIESFDAKSLLLSGLTKYNDAFFNTKDKFTITTDRAQIQFITKRRLQIDGEVIGEFKEIEIQAIPNAVRFIKTTS